MAGQRTITLQFDEEGHFILEPLEKPIEIDTSKISPYTGRKIGRAFYNAFMEFISDPENEAMIERETAERRAREAAERGETDDA